MLKDALHINRPMPPRPIPVCWDVKLGHDVDPQGPIAFNLDREEPPPVLSSASEVDKPKKEKKGKAAADGDEPKKKEKPPEAVHRTIPAMGLGTFQMDERAAELATATALRHGYTHIDTAESYHNEAGIGRALAAAGALNGAGRDNVFITTKVWPGSDEAVKSSEEVVAACKASLARLQLKSVDLYLIHTPFGGTEGRLGLYRGLVECKRLGLAKSIGVSNFSQGMHRATAGS